jgi:O-antigen/teichoic acid export membrane protein
MNLVRHVMSDSLYRNSFYLFLSSGITAVTGFLFWTVAARLFSPADVGLVSTLIAAATFVGSASIFGLDHTLIHYLGKHPKKMSTIMSTALTVAIVGVFVTSAVYLLIVPRIAPELSFILSSFLWLAGFLTLMLVTTWNNLLTSMFIGLRITYFVLLAGVLTGIARVALLPVFSEYGFAGLFSAHLLAFGVGIIAAFLGIFIVKRYVFVPHITGEVVTLIKGYSLKTYAASLLASLPPLLTPLFVIGLLGPSEVAYYNMPFMIIGLLTIIPMATSQSLFAEGVNGSSDLKRHIIRAVKLIYLLLIPVVAIILLTGSWVLGLFGASYAEHGYGLLVLLSIAALFKAGSFPLIAVLRVLGDIKEIVIVTLVYTICIVGATYAAITATGSLWAIGVAVLASEVVALVLYSMVLRRKWPKVVVIKQNSMQEESLNA